VEVVEVDHAFGGHTVGLRRKLEFRYESSLSSCQIGYDDRPDPINHRVTGQSEYGPVPPGVLANQMSPRCIEPVRPIFRGTPIRYQAKLRIGLQSGLHGTPACSALGQETASMMSPPPRRRAPRSRNVFGSIESGVHSATPNVSSSCCLAWVR
jgi:hypothetical protein